MGVGGQDWEIMLVGTGGDLRRKRIWGCGREKYKVVIYGGPRDRRTDLEGADNNDDSHELIGCFLSASFFSE